MADSYVQRYRDIDGIGAVKVTNGQVDEPIEQNYRIHVNTIAALYNPVTTPSPTTSDVAQLLTAMTLLKLVATNSVFDEDNNLLTAPTPSYIAADMAEMIDLLSRSLKAAGINTSADVDAMKRWQDLPEVGNIINRAIVAADTNKSLVSMIQTEYISTGNQILYEQFSKLEEKLRLSEKSLKLLGEIQNLHNQVRPLEADEIPSATPTGQYAIVGVPSGTTGPSWEPTVLKRVLKKLSDGGFFSSGGLAEILHNSSLFLDITSTSTTLSRANFDALKGNSVFNFYNPTNGNFNLDNLYKQAYSELSDELLKSPEGIPIKVVFNGKTGDATLDAQRGAIFESLTELRGKLLSYDVFGKLKEQIVAAAKAERNATFTVDDIDLPANTTGIDTGSIEYKLRKVYNDIKNIDSDDKVNAWLIDNVNTHVDNVSTRIAGDIQRNLTEAITAGQNNNDQANQKLRQTMFLFESFYTSANSMIQRIKRIVIDIAKNIVTRG